jgi:hypothetical protein
MRYPLESPSSILGSGNAFYQYLLDNISIPAKLTHTIWFNGMNKLKEDPSHPFQGFFPIGKTLRISYGNNEMESYTFTGAEKNPIFVKDLSPDAVEELGISLDADPNAKVFNPFFRPYEELPDKTRKDNELPTLSLAKTIGHFLGAKDILFTEKDVVDMLTVAVIRCSSEEMRILLHGNHTAWCAARFMDTGIMEADIRKQFFGQNTIEFYIKDIGTIMPGILYSLAVLGTDPVEAIQNLDYDLYGIEGAAVALRSYMKRVPQEVMAET